MSEIILFRPEDRYPVPISSFALPSDLSIFQTHFGDQTYYADYAGIARQQWATKILEIGVRFGYSGIAMCLGALSIEPHATLHYVGLDAEFFGGYPPDEPDKLVGSHVLARHHFGKMIPGFVPDLRTVDTRHGLPGDVAGWHDYFDLVNVDGDHSYEGAFDDMTNTWPLVRPGGLMLIDDTGMAGVSQAIREKIAQWDERHTLAGWQWYSNERGLCILKKKDADAG